MTDSKMDRKARIVVLALYLFDQMATKKLMRAMKIRSQKRRFCRLRQGADYSLTCAGTESAWSASAHLRRGRRWRHPIWIARRGMGSGSLEPMNDMLRIG